LFFELFFVIFVFFVVNHLIVFSLDLGNHFLSKLLLFFDFHGGLLKR